MTLVELTELIIKSLLKDPESLSVKQFDTEEEIVIEVVVPEDEIGTIIGKDGKIANSIRTIVQASSFIKNEKKVKINISSI